MYTGSLAYQCREGGVAPIRPGDRVFSGKCIGLYHFQNILLTACEEAYSD